MIKGKDYMVEDGDIMLIKVGVVKGQRQMICFDVMCFFDEVDDVKRCFG